MDYLGSYIPYVYACEISVILMVILILLNSLLLARLLLLGLKYFAISLRAFFKQSSVAFAFLLTTRRNVENAESADGWDNLYALNAM